MKFLVFARWSEVDQHYEKVGVCDSQDDADDMAAEARDDGAIATRVEVRQFPEPKKGKKDAKAPKTDKE